MEGTQHLFQIKKARTEVDQLKQLFFPNGARRAIQGEKKKLSRKKKEAPETG